MDSRGAALPDEREKKKENASLYRKVCCPLKLKGMINVRNVSQTLFSILSDLQSYKLLGDWYYYFPSFCVYFVGHIEVIAPVALLGGENAV